MNELRSSAEVIRAIEPVIGVRQLAPMTSMIELDGPEWALVENLFDPPGREGRPATDARRAMVDAILFIARTGCQWRCLPASPRLSRGYEGSAESARAWLEVAALGYLFARLRVEPA